MIKKLFAIVYKYIVGIGSILNSIVISIMLFTSNFKEHIILNTFWTILDILFLIVGITSIIAEYQYNKTIKNGLLGKTNKIPMLKVKLLREGFVKGGLNETPVSSKPNTPPPPSKIKENK